MSRPQTPLSVRLFGPPRVTLGGAPFVLRAPSRALLVIAFLALNAGIASRRRIAFALWPDTDEAGALANLRRHLALLEEALPGDPPWIGKDRVNLRWLGEGRADIDVVRYEATGPENTANQETADLYTGDLCDGVADEWLAPHRERLRDRQLAMLERLVARYRDEVNLPAALGATQAALQIDPWREDVVRERLSIRFELGDRAGAVNEYLRFRERLGAEMGVEPLPETEAAFASFAEAKKSGADARPSGTRPRDNLPLPLTTFHGRSDEMAALKDRLHDARLVTIWGPGGLGKTRLAVEYALRERDDFEGGVRFVNLASVSEADVVREAIATAIGIHRLGGRDPVAAAADVLGERRVLVIFDNCEHVLDFVASFCGSLLARCPNVRVVATSREPLGMQGESVFDLRPLHVPGYETSLPSSEILMLPAVEIFMNRAALPMSHVSDTTVRYVLEICRHLDGLPLAIELAAAQATSMGVEELMRSLEHRFDVLTSGNRAALPRQQTMYATIDWSFERLPDAERDVFVQLGAFSGEFTRAAAAAVCRVVANEPRIVADALKHLVSKSLLNESFVDDERRYYFLETIRAFSQEKLRMHPQCVDVRRRHAEKYIDIAAETEDSFWTGTTRGWLRRIEAEIDDVRSALHWLFDEARDPQSGVRLLNSLSAFWLDSCRFAEAEAWNARAIEIGELALGRSAFVKLHVDANLYLNRLGRGALAREHIDEAMRLGAECDDALGCELRMMYAITAMRQNDTSVDVAAVQREALAAARRAGDVRHEAQILLHIGFGPFTKTADEGALYESLEIAFLHGFRWIAFRARHALSVAADIAGRSEAAQVLLLDAVATYREGGSRGRHFASWMLLKYAKLEMTRASFGKAHDALVEVFSIAATLGTKVACCEPLLLAAEIAAMCSQPEAAAELFGAASAFAGDETDPALRELFRASIETRMECLPARSEIERSFHLGREFGIADARRALLRIELPAATEDVARLAPDRPVREHTNGAKPSPYHPFAALTI